MRPVYGISLNWCEFSEAHPSVVTRCEDGSNFIGYLCPLLGASGKVFGRQLFDNVPKWKSYLQVVITSERRKRLWGTFK